MKQRITIILMGLGLYLVSAGISYAAFSLFPSPLGLTRVVSPVPKVSPVQKVKIKVDPSVPRDQICPLNGEKYTKQEKDIWDSRRPLAVMIENSDEARPQSGLSRADIVYEALAEGWITRFMAVYYCNTPMENIIFAPVRSARTYFVDWVSEYDALYLHVGGANRFGENADKTDPRADAIGQIDRYGIKDMDQMGIGYPDCYRNPDRLDHPVKTEHTMICFSENIYKLAEKRNGWTEVDDRGIRWDKNFKEWTYKDDGKEKGSTNKIKLVFAEGYDKYDVEWDFDPSTNSYKRTNGGTPHLDLETKEQLAAKNVVVQLTKLIGPVDSDGHFLYTTIGSGKALIFQDGKVIVGSWSKKTRIDRTKFFDATGKEMAFNRGLTWMEILPSEQQVTY
jgi:hypothetical protein